MRYLKMLGLAAVAAGALAAFTAGPALAGETLPNTVLCKTNTSTTCPTASQYGIGTKVKAELTGTAKLKAGFAVIECGKSIVEGKTETVDTPEGQITTETFTECASGQTVTVNSKGKLSIHHETGTSSTGVLKVGSGNSVTVKVGSTECTYGGTTSGSGVMVNGGSPATAVASEEETKLTKTAGGILCASPASWIATYDVVEPNPLYVATTP